MMTEEQLAALKVIVEQAYDTMDDETCMCGDSVNHSEWDAGHSAVPMRSYSLKPVTDALMKDNGMTRSQAWEHIEAWGTRDNSKLFTNH